MCVCCQIGCVVARCRARAIRLLLRIVWFDSIYRNDKRYGNFVFFLPYLWHCLIVNSFSLVYRIFSVRVVSPLDDEFWPVIFGFLSLVTWFFFSSIFRGLVVYFGFRIMFVMVWCMLLRALLSFLPHRRRRRHHCRRRRRQQSCCCYVFFICFSLHTALPLVIECAYNIYARFFRSFVRLFIRYKLELHASVIIFYNCSQHKHKSHDSNRAETFLPLNWWIGLMATPTINAMTAKIENTRTKCTFHVCASAACCCCFSSSS